jgi:23S rRNA (guanosine2251-2'-O)-methyltransferase
MKAAESELIAGLHSIIAALENSERELVHVYGTDEGISELKKRSEFARKNLTKENTRLYSPHRFQEECKKLYRELEYNYNRVPSGVLLKTTPLESYDLSKIYLALDKGQKPKILCLDQVTDAHNGAAIMRTASFYGVDFIVTAQKGNFGGGPQFARIASGALEHIPLVRVASLPKAINKLQDKGVRCIGFSEHEKNETSSDETSEDAAICLIVGAEDTGLSNAVLRILKETVALKPKGQMRSLNVSVATAIAMERFF